jgi:hypothetical protein
VRTSQNSVKAKFAELTFRDCLENPNEPHSGGPGVGKTGREAPLSALYATKNARSKPLQRFSKQFLHALW